MDQFLRASDVFDWPHPRGAAASELLADSSKDRVVVAQR